MIQVVDSSAVVAALVDTTPEALWCEERLAELDLAAPHLMPFEAANIIRRTVARGAMDSSEGDAAVRDLERLDIDLLPFLPLAERAWSLRANLTIYDACYVAAAELLQCRLVTLDSRLARAPGLGCNVVVAP